MADKKEYKAEYLKQLEALPEVEQTPGINSPFLTDMNVILPDASQISYDNGSSWLSATNVQDALDEIVSLLP